jgi:hypothetical protein
MLLDVREDTSVEAANPIDIRARISGHSDRQTVFLIHGENVAAVSWRIKVSWIPT